MVRQALKLVDANSDIAGVHSMSEEIREKLQDKHPARRQPDPRNDTSKGGICNI